MVVPPALHSLSVPPRSLQPSMGGGAGTVSIPTAPSSVLMGGAGGVLALLPDHTVILEGQGLNPVDVGHSPPGVTVPGHPLPTP